MTCHFCRISSKIRFPVETEIDGVKYCFCMRCLKNMTAAQFWQRIDN